MSLSDYRTLRTLSKTPKFTLYKVQATSTLKLYTLKQVHLAAATESAKEAYFTEAQLLASTNSAHLLCYKKVFYDTPNSLCILMEYAKGPTLKDKIYEHKQNRTLFAECEIWDVLRQVTLGLKALHDLKLTHRNLTSSNILLSKNNRVKLYGFQLDKALKVSSLSELAQYSSPEVWKNQLYDSKCDIWSLGCILYEMCALALPFQGSSSRILIRNILQCAYLPIPETCSSELAELIRQLLSVDAGARLNCRKILLAPLTVIVVSSPDEDGRVVFSESAEDLRKSPSCNPFKFLSCSPKEVPGRSPLPFVANSKSSSILLDTLICKETIEAKLKLLKRKYDRTGKQRLLVPRSRYN